MDFFTVPTITFGTLCCFFIISHDSQENSPRQRHPSPHVFLDRSAIA